MTLPRFVSAVSAVILFTSLNSLPSQAADKELLDILLENGVITEAQYDRLINKASITTKDIVVTRSTQKSVADPGGETRVEVPVDDGLQLAIDRAVAKTVSDKSPIVASYGSKGFKLATRDGKFATNLQWRAQFRYSNPTDSDPRQIDDFGGYAFSAANPREIIRVSDESRSNFEQRRLRMKIGGHGFQPWLKYYFEVDLQPARDVDDNAASASARVIDWRVDIAKWDWGGIRLGQWKIDLNRERVDSSGRQQFVERSIVNRVFTVDRQIGLQLRGRLFEGTATDLNYYAGIFNGEGRGVRNSSEDHLYMGRLQWNFLGRELAWKQTDVEYTELPTGSFAIAGFTNTGPCTRWSSSGCGNLDGFTKAASAAPDQFKIEQGVQEFAFKYRGFSFQQEWHRKFITDRVEGTRSDLTGAYVQAGYFFHDWIDAIPAPLEFAARYAYVEEPNAFDRNVYNEREEFTLGANWFFRGHSNKLTLDLSRLILDDGLLDRSVSENRVRLQWDVSF